MRSRPSEETKNSMDNSNRNPKNASSQEETQGRNNNHRKIKNKSAKNNLKRTTRTRRRKRRKAPAKKSKTKTTMTVIFEGNRINSPKHNTWTIKIYNSNVLRSRQISLFTVTPPSPPRLHSQTSPFSLPKWRLTIRERVDSLWRYYAGNGNSFLFLSMVNVVLSFGIKHFVTLIHLFFSSPIYKCLADAELRTTLIPLPKRSSLENL